MKKLKGCFNEKCVINKRKDKLDDTNDFCLKCGSELVYVCMDKKCYNPLHNVLKEYCGECLTKKQEHKEKVKVQMMEFGKAVPSAVASLATIAVTILNNNKNSTKFIPKKK